MWENLVPPGRPLAATERSRRLTPRVYVKCSKLNPLESIRRALADQLHLPPASVERVASWSGDILTYRWYGFQDMFYWVYLDGGQVVQKAHPGVEERLSLIPDRP